MWQFGADNNEKVPTMFNTPLVAIINDDPAFLEFISSFLEQETDYRTVVWDDGTDSLTRLRAHRPDLVILDVKLGDQAVGEQILRQMRADDVLASMPVIICTADSSFLRANGHVLDELSADVLEKPFDLEVLEEKVELAIKHSHSGYGEPDPVG